jgi:hypothetical protein
MYQQAVRHNIDIFEPDRWNSVAAVAQTSSLTTANVAGYLSLLPNIARQLRGTPTVRLQQRHT